jgi:erythronate-4-phosphate dehydrogenase
MPYAREAFSALGDVTLLDGRSISADDVRDAEILAIRSTTRVDAALLGGSAAKFVGTATIGTDHMDVSYLEDRGITWCYSPGCNANSVSEYLTAALLCLANRHGFTIEGKTIVVIGVGNVGSLVVDKARTLGMRVLPNDPPRARLEADAQEEFVDLDQVLDEADIVTFHVPLTRGGTDRTLHMADAAFFRRLKPGCVFVNSARGAVVDTDALIAAMGDGTVSHAVIDTWEGEPAYREDLLERVDIGTPHIAGHSFEGKVMGTVMVYREACRFLGVEAGWTPDALLPEPLVPRLEVDAAGKTDEQVLWEIVKPVYEIEADDRRLRGEKGQGTMDHGQGTGGRAAHFDGLRKSYPVRREFRFTEVALRNASEDLTDKVFGLGFTGGAELDT